MEGNQATATRCIFCRNDSSSSRSIEHIIPESLGNTTAILPRGIVCDVCNNYFARKVEAPFLESALVRSLRFDQRLQNKKGRVPKIEGVIRPDIPAELCYFPERGQTSIGIPPELFPYLNQHPFEAYFPLGGPPPSDRIVSRFFAKIALESLARRYAPYPAGLAYLCDERQLNPLREHARRGHIEDWPVHIRVLYPPESAILENEELRQVVHESDFLVTPWDEWFHVVVIFGTEFTINIGGPEIDGYLRWLQGSGGVSPLYIGENARSYAMPRPVDNVKP